MLREARHRRLVLISTMGLSVARGGQPFPFASCVKSQDLDARTMSAYV